MAKSAWKKEGRDLLRAIAGGTIFGVPLLYTMEMWEAGAIFQPLHLLAALLIAIVFNFIFSIAWGIREDSHIFTAVNDAISSVGISLVLSTAVLALINQLNFSEDITGSLGKIIIESIVISIGIAFTADRFRQNDEQDEKQQEPEKRSDLELRRLQLKDDLRDIGGSVAGATVFAFNVAPTEEVLLIATKLNPAHMITLFVAEIVIAYIILFASGLWQREVFIKDSVFQKPWAETVMAVAIGLTVAAALIWSFGFEGTSSSLESFMTSLVALSFPAVIGASAGRLVV